MMPGISGIEVCRRLRSNPITTNIPILMLTAQGQAEDAAEGLNIGADEYVTKPFKHIELEARINALLRRAKRHAPTQPALYRSPTIV